MLRTPSQPLQQERAQEHSLYGSPDLDIHGYNRSLHKSKCEFFFSSEYKKKRISGLQVIFSCDATVPEITNEMFGYDPNDPPDTDEGIRQLVYNYVNATTTLKQVTEARCILFLSPKILVLCLRSMLLPTQIRFLHQC